MAQSLVQYLSLVGPSDRKRGHHRLSEYRCGACGGLTYQRPRDVERNAVKSCGCQRTALRPDALVRHPLYHSWTQIKGRCYNPNDASYRNYGARGIKMADEWLNDPRAFLAWMDVELGERPEGMSLDRIDNDGHYAPGNLRWATRSQQTNNRREGIYSRVDIMAERDLWRERAITLGWVD